MNQPLRLFNDATAGFRPDAPSSNVYVSIVVPTYQEVENLAELAARLFAFISIAQLKAELIVVDDNSKDGTIELCEELAEMYPVRLVTRTKERGLATAVIRGLQEATGEYIVVMDADLSHPPMSVPSLLTPLETDEADFVIGSRYVDGGSIDESWSFFRRLNSRIAGWLARGLTTAKDPMAGFFAIRRDTPGGLPKLNPCGYKIGLELMVRCGCDRIVEIPIHFEDRQYGESKLNLREQGLYIQHLFRLYAFRFPELFRFATFGAVGASGMLLDVALFRSLFPVIGLAAGRAVAIWTAMTWNFEFNRRFTFKEPIDSNRLAEYARFCTACLLGAGISWSTSLGLMAATTSFATRPITAALIGTGIAAVANYALCKMWVFGKRKPLQPPALPELSMDVFVATDPSQSKAAA